MTTRFIFHAHNWPFLRIQQHLEQLSNDGFSHVQISPAQKSPAGDLWSLRYQPVDHLVIDGLGESEDLKKLCSSAHKLGITIIADLVFNHMAILKGGMRDDWAQATSKAAKGDSTKLEALQRQLDQFPNLSRQDFQPWKEMQGADWDNENRYESWGNGEWSELKPTANVLNLHFRHMDLLYACGVRAFRFDAVKHMRPTHVLEYVKHVRSYPEVCWCYGEVFSIDPKMHREYDFLPTTDFPFVFRLKADCKERQFEFDPAQAFLSKDSIRFGMNHDLALNPPELVSGLLFEKPQQTALANALAVLCEDGAALVFNDDRNDPTVKFCMNYRKTNSGLTEKIRISDSNGHWILKTGTQTLHVPYRQ